MSTKNRLIVQSLEELVADGSAFRVLHDQSSEPTSVVDIYGNPKYVNHANVAVSGFSYEQLSSAETIANMVSTESKALFEEFWEFYAQNGYFREENLLITWINAKGEKILLDNVIVNVYDTQEKVIGFITASRNVTAFYNLKSEIELALEKSKANEQRLNILIEKTPIPICFFNANGQPTRINEAFEGLSGKSYDELKNLNLFEDEAFNQGEFGLALIELFNSGGSISTPVIKYAGQALGDGKNPIYISADIVANRVDDSVSEVVMFIKDFTKEKQNEILLNEVNALAKVGGWSYNLAENELTFTAETYNIHDIPSGEKLEFAAIFNTMYLHGDQAGTLKSFERLMIDYQPIDEICTIKTRVGMFKFVRFIGRPEIVDKSLLRVYGLVQDVTEEELQRRALDQTNKELIKTNQQLDQFVYSVSHDLRAPLTSIMGLVELCNQTADIEEIKSYLDLIKSSANRLDDFIQDIINLSKNSRQTLEIEEIDIDNLIKGCFEQMAYMTNADKVLLSHNVVLKKPLFSDLRRLDIILNNLISNSIRYADLTKAKPAVHVEVLIEKEYCKIEIADNGQGIAQELQSKVFEMFYRGHESSDGTGLGLYIVQETVEKLMGQIKLKSKEGEFTQFTVTIPNLKGKTTL